MAASAHSLVKAVLRTHEPLTTIGVSKVKDNTKRIVLVMIVAVGVVTVGGTAIASSSSVESITETNPVLDTCRSASGAVCTAESEFGCCANGKACYAVQELCEALFCESYPQAPICKGTSGRVTPSSP